MLTNNNHGNRRQRLLGLILAGVLAQTAWAGAEAAVDAYPPQGVGLVLGGGGARGFAHLGVLKELERLRVPIACIAGTSAGALIGGIYANGLPLEQMEREFDGADWEALLSGKPVRADVPYDRKRDDYKNYLDITFGLKKDGLGVPRSAINSQEIELYIHKLTRDRVVGNFDQLPIPFRAIATDLATGEPVVFSQGSLARALRASMAVPGLFDLIEDDEGRLLVDGGLARNLPIQDVKGRCADHVIVVDVSTPLMKAGEIHSLFDVVAQTSNLMVSRNAKEQMRKLDKSDIVIKPDLNGYTSASFNEHQAITQRGEAAAKALAKQLEAYSVSEEEYAAWRRRLARPHFPLIDKIQVEGKPGQFTKPEQLAKSLAFSSVVEPVSSAQSRLRGVFAGGDYDRLTYRVDNVSGRNVMTVLPLERSIGPNFMRFGLNLSSATPGESNFNFLASHEWRNANSAGGAWRNDVSIGQNKLIKTEWYQPLYEGSPVFTAASLGYRQDFLPVYNSDHTLNLEWNNNVGSVRLDGGLALGRYGEWRIGAYRDDNHFSSRVSWLPGVVPPNYRDTGIASSLVVDQFDNPKWPRAGYFFSGRVTKSIPSWGSDVNLTSYDTVLEYAKTLGSVTMRLSAKNKGALNRGNDEAFLVVPRSLGGFLNLSGYQDSELIGERSSLFRSMLYWRASSLPAALGSGVYAGISMELGKIWGRVGTNDWSQSNSDWIPAGSVFLAADTIIGPFFVGMGTARGGKPTAYLYLGTDY